MGGFECQSFPSMRRLRTRISTDIAINLFFKEPTVSTKHSPRIFFQIFHTVILDIDILPPSPKIDISNFLAIPSSDP